jgi:hypothetical protein
MGRDVFNEKPSTEELLAAEAGATSALPRGACIHTTKVGAQWLHDMLRCLRCSRLLLPGVLSW